MAKLLGRLRDRVRALHHSIRSEAAYAEVHALASLMDLGAANRLRVTDAKRRGNDRESRVVEEETTLP
jgi:hypothetical protein